MNVLALETSGKVMTVALRCGDAFYETTVSRGFRHTETLMPAADALVKMAGIEPGDLDLVTCSAGPGSFTGLRIGMSAAKGIARGAGCPLKAVPVLPLLAAGHEHWPGIVVPVIDARKNRVYTAAFKNGKRLRDDSDTALAQFLSALPSGENLLITGPDASAASGFNRVTINPVSCSGTGRLMIETAVKALENEGPDPPDLGPVYLRLSEAEAKLQEADEEPEPLELAVSVPDSEGVCVSDNWLVQNDSVQAPLVILDADLMIQWCNQTFRSYLDTQTGESFTNCFFLEQKLHERMLKSLRNSEFGFGWNGRVNGRGLTNRQFTAYLNIFPLEYTADGKPEMYLAVITDVTKSEKATIRANFDSILKAALLKDEGTGNHIERVNCYSRMIAEQLKGDIQWTYRKFDDRLSDDGFSLVDDDFIEDIGLLAAFHDVGKIGTPESILMKNGKLTEDEWKVMKEHPINGALILDAHPNSMVKRIALFHHERWDGSGYPYSLTGDDLRGGIPLSARIVAVADVYDALRTSRPYKKAFSEEYTNHVITSGAGQQFDPGLVEVYKKLRTEFDKVFHSLTG